MNEELKPCPFCENIPSLMESDKGSDIYCTTDGCYIPPSLRKSKMEIVEYQGKKYEKVPYVADCKGCAFVVVEKEIASCAVHDEETMLCFKLVSGRVHSQWMFNEVE